MEILEYAVFHFGVHTLFRDDAGKVWLHIKNRTTDMLTGKPYNNMIRIPEERVEKWRAHFARERARSLAAKPPAHNRSNGGSNPSGHTT